jgi:hypothetical protein
MTTRTFTVLAKGSAALALVLPLSAAAATSGLRPAGLTCSEGKPSQAVCQAKEGTMNEVGDVSDALDTAGAPQLPGAPKAPGAPGGPTTPQPPSLPQPGK